MMAILYVTMPIWGIPVFGAIYSKEAWDMWRMNKKRKEAEMLEDTDARGVEEA